MSLEMLREQANQATVQEAAEIMDVHRHAVQCAVTDGVIPSKFADREQTSVRNGREYKTRRRMRVVDLEDVQAWIDIRKASRRTHAL